MPQIEAFLNAAPKRVFERFGYGLSAVRENDWKSRIDAAKAVLEILDAGEVPEKSMQVVTALETVRGLFSKVHFCNQYDWFTTFRMLGFPSPILAGKIMTCLADLKDLVLLDKSASAACALEKLAEFPLDDMLSCYLDYAARGRQLLDERGFAYILWSSSEPNIFGIGVTDDTVDDAIRHYTRQTRGSGRHPFGVMFACLVENPERARSLVSKAFDESSIGNGFYEVNLGHAFRRLSNVLEVNGQMCLSPWEDTVSEDASCLYNRAV